MSELAYVLVYLHTTVLTGVKRVQRPRSMSVTYGASVDEEEQGNKKKKKKVNKKKKGIKKNKKDEESEEKDMK